MSKELEALNDMLEYLLTYDEFNEKRHKHNASIIETALKDYEETDNQLYDLFEKFGINNRNDLLKKLKALEIIKEKEWFDDFMKEHLNREWFTKEELNLLNKVLL